MCTRGTALMNTGLQGVRWYNLYAGLYKLVAILAALYFGYIMYDRVYSMDVGA